MKIDDSQLYALFAGMLDAAGHVQIAPTNAASDPYVVDVELEVQDNHRGDSPDVILRVRLSINHPKLPTLDLEIPIPIEGEKAGISAAIEDLRKFTEREHFIQEMPMPVIGGSGNPARRVQQIKMPTRVEIAQIPYRLLSP